MTVRVRLAGPPHEHFAPDADVSACVGQRVTYRGPGDADEIEIATITEAHVVDDALDCAIEFDDDEWERRIMGSLSLPRGFYTV